MSAQLEHQSFQSVQFSNRAVSDAQLIILIEHLRDWWGLYPHIDFFNTNLSGQCSSDYSVIMPMSSTNHTYRASSNLVRYTVSWWSYTRILAHIGPHWFFEVFPTYNYCTMTVYILLSENAVYRHELVVRRLGMRLMSPECDCIS